MADQTGLTHALSTGLGSIRERAGGHDPGRVVRDLCVMLADGGDCLADLRAVRDQAPLFGPVASDSTSFRVLDRIASGPGCSTPCAAPVHERASARGSSVSRPSGRRSTSTRRS